MYTGYFGLKEKPFSIAPDPQYLFMSDRHREALAHLTYGLGDTGGFVLLTGEVGTGKTTISRCLMERLPDNTQVAFILNPTLSSQELLATICDELKVRYRKTGATLKTLTDKIQEKLLKNHKDNINTLLIIDEAQHLQPDVLEQLRLLTNLETNTKKLLQVILIGQPELQVLLKRRDLRQLAQRITARYHLLALNKQEVVQYIKHRLSVGECFRDVFSVSAMASVHQICGGIPRLINLVCERSLVNAYSSNNTLINKKIIIQSAQEALGDDYKLTSWWHHNMVKMIAVNVLVVALLFSGYWFAKEDFTQTSEKLSVIEQSPTSDIQNSKPLLDKINVDNKNITDTVKYEEQGVIESSATPVDKITKVSAIKNSNVSESFLPESNPKTSLIKNTVPTIAPVNNPPEFKVNAVDGVSDDLLTLFQSAIDETDNDSDIKNKTIKSNNILPLTEMPQWVQKAVPKLEFDMHIYASDGKGWVRVNGRERYEGDYIDRELLLSEIQPQTVVLTFRGEKFTMPALSSW